MRRRILVRLQYDGTNYEYYSTEDIDYDSKHWEKRVISWSPIEESQSDMFYGRRNLSPLSIVFDNTDKHFTDLDYYNDLRQRELIVYRYDKDNPYYAETIYFYIASVEISLKECRITAIREHVAKLDETYPRGRVTTTLFPGATAPSIGKPIPICLGYSVLVPCIVVYESDPLNMYDYLIGYGTIDSLTLVYRNWITVDPSEYTFYDGTQGSPYPGYAFLRFAVEQRDSNNNLYDISALVNGIEISGSHSQNPATNLKEFLTNTTWGMGLSCNATSFSTAATACNNLSLISRICINTFDKASEWVNKLLAACYWASLYKKQDYEMTVPAYISGSSGVFTKYNMADIVLYRPPIDEFVKMVSVYSYYNNVDEQYMYSSSYDTGKSFGMTKEYYSPFAYTGDEVKSAKMLGKRFRFQDVFVEFVTGGDGWERQVGEIITINNKDINIDNLPFEIFYISKGHSEIKIKCRLYTDLIFS